MQNPVQSITKKTFLGGVWGIGAQALMRVLDLATLALLARVLEPSDFGLVAIAMSIILIAEAVLELPTTAVLVVSAEISEAMLETAFTLGFLRAMVVALLASLAGLLVSVLYGDARLLLLTAVLSIAPASRGMVSPRIAVLAQNFEFRPQFIINVSGKCVSFAIAVALALYTRSYWAIAAGTIMAPIVTTLGSYYVAPFRPRFSLQGWARFAGYLGWNAVSQVISALSWQLDRLLLPRMISTLSLGLYTTAAEISSLPFKAIGQSITAPLLSAFSAASASPERNLRERYLRALDFLMTGMLPGFVILATFSDAIIAFALGQKWAGAASILSWMSIGGILSTSRVLFSPAVMSIGRPKLITILGGLELLAKLPLLLALIPLFGIAGALTSQIVAAVVGLVSSIWLISRFGAIPVRAQLLVMGGPVFAATGMCLVGALLAPKPPFPADSWLLLVFMLRGIILSLLVYAALLLLAWLAAARPRGVVQMLISVMTKKRLVD